MDIISFVHIFVVTYIPDLNFFKMTFNINLCCSDCNIRSICCYLCWENIVAIYIKHIWRGG